ncbi:MAG: hypothetical protein ACXAEN_25590 [Candidatus Thorarchaeota archaeon]|jgi:hypothetical protein
MHPSLIRKAKALVWYWLNRHPAEVVFSESPTEMGSYEFTYGTLELDMNHDMLIQGRTHYNIGTGRSEGVAKYRDPDRWQDISGVITRWYEGLIKCDQWMVYKWLKKVKGEPIDRWAKKYTGLPAPDWSGLIEGFLSAELIRVNIDQDTLK